MVDLESRVDKLEERVQKVELDIKESLGDIKSSLVEIKASLEEKTRSGDLKNELIKSQINAAIESLKARTEDLEKRVSAAEDAKKWLVRLVLGTIVGLILEAVAFYLSLKP